MKEIKFRAWDIISYFDNEKPEKEMIYFYLYETRKIENLSLEAVEMQYTGLKDISNKEIYEGDILQGGYVNKLTGGFESRLYIVEFEKGTFKGKLIGESPYGDTWLNFINKKSYVIGNIYENPELLEA
ncbi:DNA-packaging protein [Clostridium sporogenes]|uniref:YopX family protein n=1 Tax=Clostridium sporogenes TaxID=1509 RepID=UPI0013F10F66|nr:YopX family protein [Clostridium sporogenes]NFH34504.1 DNA-packaging protein [Clostridium sporogenes]NFL21859.1 DNA-packaging protein [Clostridium sporogenes]NFN74368.1 DNA-packaging protein [Clostridium sporogenes]NFV23811.1 DNA-packaging protein [Clostridium sporogenes]